MAIKNRYDVHCRVCGTRFVLVGYHKYKLRKKQPCPICHAWPGNLVLDKKERGDT